MSNIRNIKKAMKNSNDFFSLQLKSGGFYCSNEWAKRRFHKKGVSFDNSTYIPYSEIKRIVNKWKS